MSGRIITHSEIDRQQIQSTLKDLKANYKLIETEIEETVKKKRDHKQVRFKEVMDRIESLKMSLKTEINNRKETEELFMSMVEKRTQEVKKDINEKYLDNLSEMK